MAVYKEEKTGTWRVIYRYTDWTGEKKQTQKRGFKTKREAQAWEREQLHKASADLDMTFESFFEQYTADMQTRIKENTWATKEHIIRTKLIPYFGKLKMSNITAQQIITWQNELMNYKDENGKPLSPVYLKTINNQLSAIFNHAVKYYNLQVDDSVREFQCNVQLDDGVHMTDFVCVKTDGELMVRECVQRKYLLKPMTIRLMDISWAYWKRHGVEDWGLVVDADKEG